MARTGAKEISCFILEDGMEGLSYGANEHKMGWNVQPTRVVNFDDIKVPKENLVGTLNDGWTILTRDNKPSAHFEHNIAIVNGKPKLLSTFDYIHKALGIKSDEEFPFK